MKIEIMFLEIMVNMIKIEEVSVIGITIGQGLRFGM